MLYLMVLPSNSHDDGIVVRVCCSGAQGDKPAVLADIKDIVVRQKLGMLIRKDAFPALSEEEKKIVQIFYKILRRSDSWSVCGPNWSTMNGHSIDIRTY